MVVVMRSLRLEYMRDMVHQLSKMAKADGFDALAFAFGIATLGADELIADLSARAARAVEKSRRAA
jgi:hypothetical protein